MFLRENGLDKFADGYGIHVYPGNDPKRTTEDRINELEKAFLSIASHGSKPCWVTEWGFANNDQNCPFKDDLRPKLIAVMREAFHKFADKRTNRKHHLLYVGVTPNGEYSDVAN